MKYNSSRRDFLKTAGLVPLAAATTMGPAGTSAFGATQPIKRAGGLC